MLDCNAAIAERVLAANNWNVENAINEYFINPAKYAAPAAAQAP